ncbi:MAG: M14 family metallopeptidase, partial [Myxococcaceae bacterium]
VASADGTFEPAAIARRARPVVFIQGGIHAGEIDGKDAGFWLLRDLLEGKAAPGVLGKVTLVFVPVFNVDGHERFGPNNRPNQNGPREMGWRVTSQNLNLNRDHAKADSPEMAAWLKLMRRFDPILHVDMHVTDGAKFQHDVSVTFEPLEQGPGPLRSMGKMLRDSLFTELTLKGHLPVGFYPSFEKEDDPASGFGYGVAPPRFASAYWMLHNRFGLLLETHSWKDYPTRVKTTYDVVLGLLTRAAEDGPRWMAAARAADTADLARGGQEVVLAYRNSEAVRTLEFQGYAYSREASAVSGKDWVRYDDTRPQVWEVPYRQELVPALTVQAPRGGYLVPPSDAAWLGEKLRLHGFKFETVTRGRPAAEVETFRATETKFAPAPYEGHQRLTVKGAWASERREVSAGSLYVPIAQKASGLLVHLMDPMGPDSFLQWGFFNARFEQKEYMEDYVAEEVARQMLKEPEVKELFEKKLASDPAFAKDPSARLRFFYRRHPTFDERLDLYPVYRTGKPLAEL